MATNIEWTHGLTTPTGQPMLGDTWNPTVGCKEVSPGCTNCYAARMAWRIQHMKNAAAKDYEGTTKKLDNGRIVWTGKVNVLRHRFNDVLNNKRPTVYFVDSMSDLFHKDVSFDFIFEVFLVMKECDRHIFQILTKREERMAQFYHDYITEPIPNIWQGVSVEDQERANRRIPFLVDVTAPVKFLSCEPLIGRVDLFNISPGGAIFFNCLQKGMINWVIAGGESGANSRPVNPEWIRFLRNQCLLEEVPFFFKQWGQFIEAEQLALMGMKIVKKGGVFSMPAPGHPSHLEFWGDHYYSLGKSVTGDMLDGYQYHQYPNRK